MPNPDSGERATESTHEPTYETQHPKDGKTEDGQNEDRRAEGGRAETAPPNAASTWSRGSEISWTAVLVILTVGVSFFHLSGGSALEGTACWVAQTAREMEESGAWIVPVFSGEPRYHKSPGPYWAVISIGRLFNTEVSAWTARVPNGIGALLIVGCVFAMARRLGSLREAMFAGFAAASSVLLLTWSHRGASDLGLAALITVSITTLWFGCEDKPGKRRILLWLTGYFFAGLAMLYKMPMPLVCVGIPAILYVVLQRRWRVLWHPAHIIGLGLFLMPWLPWVMLIVQSEPDAWLRWKVEFFDRFTGTLPNVQYETGWEHQLLYVGAAFALVFPYSLSLPAALLSWQRKEGDARRGTFFMLFWFVGLLFFFTLSAGKETRYFLPAIPPLFVLLGQELSYLFDPSHVIAPWKIRAACYSVCLAVPAGLTVGGFVLRRLAESHVFISAESLFPYYLVAAVLFAVTTCVSAGLYLRAKRTEAFGLLVLGMCISFCWTWVFVMPVVRSESADKNFAAQLREAVTEERLPHTAQVGHQNPTIVWYSDVRVPRLIDPMDLLRMQDGQRNLMRERGIYGNTMIDRLNGEEPTLLIIRFGDFRDFLAALPELRTAEEYPPMHVWVRTDAGPRSKITYLIGNRPPPWEEPDARQLQESLIERREEAAAASRS